MPTVRAVIGRFIIERRGKRNQTAFGKEVGISQPVVSALETGARGLRVEHLEAMLEALNIETVIGFRMLLRVAEDIAKEEAGAQSVPLGELVETTKRGAVNPSKAKFVASESKKKPKQTKKKPPGELPGSASEERPRRPSHNS